MDPKNILASRLFYNTNAEISFLIILLIYKKNTSPGFT